MATDPNIEALIQASVTAALRKVRAPLTRWAVVDDHDPIAGQLLVVVDGDDGTAIQANDATGSVFASGQRVLVLYTPPQAVHVIGSRPGPPIEYTPTLENVDVGDGTVVGEYHATDGIVDYAVVVTLGAGATVSGAITVGLPLQGSSLVVADWLTLARATIGLAVYTGAAVYQPATDTLTVGSIGSDGLGHWATTVPAAWGAGDVLRLTGRYPLRLPIENTE